MHKRELKYSFIVIALLLLIVVAFYLHLTNGMFDISIGEVFQTLFNLNDNEKFRLVVFEFRLPRIIIAILVGVGLSIAGLFLQGITKNELADPGILGINSGAGAAVIIYMFFVHFNSSVSDGSNFLSIFAMPIFGFIGGIAAAMLILLFSKNNNKMDMQRLILTGIAINSGFSAISMLFSMKMNASDFEFAAVWQTGSIYNANWTFIYMMLPWIIFLGLYLYRKVHLLDYFQLEEGSIISLGINLEKEKRKLLFACVGLISSCVCVAGNIGFIGLMAPHIARQLVGIKHRKLMPVTALIGAFLLVISDFIAKTVFAPSELAVGIVVSIIGIPYFVYLLFKS
ncbi:MULTISPECIES: iron ABC transporter permease [unclassified Clostridium]|uniref:FecCD family ABC transporter permease n=1 Tax=unclassified Clostridium TaxID=2614128 RepID=UPI0013F0CF6B|nr:MULTISPECIES: iron ABC transporter permease [unclassified Clostridium]NFG61128.1 iron ABC transporter permease [Clostridium botulinum]NFQ08874.1 iron ABC transporter permease [Clostridium botulinum]